MIKKSVLFFEEKVILLSYCPFHIFLDDLSVYLKTNFRKAKRDRSPIFGILDINVQFKMHIQYFGENMLRLRLMTLLKTDF